MSIRICFTLILSMFISGCADNPAMCRHMCGHDYWGDCRTEIFGVNNSVGYIGHWQDEYDGNNGYYCKNVDCSQKERVTVPYTSPGCRNTVDSRCPTNSPCQRYRICTK